MPILLLSLTLSLVLIPFRFIQSLLSCLSVYKYNKIQYCSLCSILYPVQNPSCSPTSSLFPIPFKSFQSPPVSSSPRYYFYDTDPSSFGQCIPVSVIIFLIKILPALPSFFQFQLASSSPQPFSLTSSQLLPVLLVSSYRPSPGQAFSSSSKFLPNQALLVSANVFQSTNSFFQFQLLFSHQDFPVPASPFQSTNSFFQSQLLSSHPDSSSYSQSLPVHKQLLPVPVTLVPSRPFLFKSISFSPQIVSSSSSHFLPIQTLPVPANLLQPTNSFFQFQLLSSHPNSSSS